MYDFTIIRVNVGGEHLRQLSAMHSFASDSAEITVTGLTNMDASKAADVLTSCASDVQIRQIQPNMGLEITGIDFDAVNLEKLAPALRALWLAHRVIFIDTEAVERSKFVEIAKVFGTPVQYPYNLFVVEDCPEVVGIFSDQQTANAWHCDLSYDVSPSSGAVLRAMSVPSVGGDTLFADGYAAYDALPDDVKERIKDLHAVHDFGAVIGYQRPENPGHQERVAKVLENRRNRPLVAHPIALKHPETGRKTLFVNEGFTTQILGLERSESRELLDLLFQQFLVPEHQLRVRWKPNAIVIWDNLSTVHYAACDYGDFKRHMERVTLRGTRLYSAI